MPPAYVKTIREEIFYEYAKLISRSAHGSIQYGIRDRNSQPTVSVGNNSHSRSIVTKGG